MNRNVRFGMLAVAALLVAVAMGVTPPDAAAIRCCYCDTGFQTQCWSKGNSCDEAQANFPSFCWDYADNACYSFGYDGACQVSPVITSSCWFDAGIGMYVFDGYADHGCRWCEDCGPIPI